MNLTVIRDQQPIKLAVTAGSFVVVESAETAEQFQTIKLPETSSGTFSANAKTSNQPLSILSDGKLDGDYGPVFPNSVSSGAYKVDLGQSKTISTINSWSFNRSKTRGTQKITIYGSKSAKDPGWKVANMERFEPLGSIDSTGLTKPFVAASLRSAPGSNLGEYRWIVWSVSPVNKSGENTAFQEFSVETLE